MLLIILSSKLLVICYLLAYIFKNTKKLENEKKPKRNQNSINPIRRYKILVKVSNFETNLNFQGHRDWGSFRVQHYTGLDVKHV